MIAPRIYRDTHDLDSMLDVLVQGRKANNGSYYVHSGDVRWWLYYPPLEGAFWEHIHVWDDPEQPGRLLGWALISPDWMSFDVYVQPELRGSETATGMYLWAEDEARRTASEAGKKAISIYWIYHGDDVLNYQLTGRGFKHKRDTVQLARSLDGEPSDPVLPPGFQLRGCEGVAEVTARARAQYGAFKNSAAFADYERRFRNFMLSPVYDPQLDIVAVAPDGQVGAFCIVWTDPANRVGLFEPVGTHPDFHRRGLGRAVMLEGMRRLKERGMTKAIVSTGEDNSQAIKLYENVGFQVENRLRIYEKEV